MSNPSENATVEDVWKVFGITSDDLTKVERLKHAEALVKQGKLKREVYETLLATTKKELEVSKGGKKAMRQFAREQQRRAMRIEVPPGKPIIEGYLYKRPKNSTSKIVGRWKRRYCALYKHCLIYYKKKGDTAPKGMLQLNADFFVSDVTDKSQQGKEAKGGAFMLSDVENSFYLGADKEAEKKFWMHTITRVLRKLQEESAYFDTPVLLDKPSRSAEQIKNDYEQRMAAYKESMRKKGARRGFFGTLRKNKSKAVIDDAELDEQAEADAIERGARELEEEEKVMAQRVEKRQTARAKEIEHYREAANKWKRRAEEATARAEELSERAESEHEAATKAKQKLQETMEELRRQAQEREMALEAERDAVKAQLQEAMKRRKSHKTGTLDKKKFQEFERERKALQAKLDALQSALHVDLDGLDWDGTLEDAEAKMRALVPALSSDDPKKAQDAQSEFDQWDKIIRNHGDYIQREKDKWVKWEQDNKEKNEQALQEMRSLVPPKLVTGMTLDELLKNKKLYPSSARRILKTQILKFLYMNKEDIAKIHVADLSSRYIPQGLDIVELRAVYTRVPPEFQNDRDGKKQVWLDNIRAKLYDFTTREEKGQLTNPEKRNPAYSAPGKSPFASSGGATRRPPMPRPSGSKKFGFGRPPAGGGRSKGGKNANNVKIGAKKIDTSALQAALAAKLGGGPPPALKGKLQKDDADGPPAPMGFPFGGGKVPKAVLESRMRAEGASPSAPPPVSPHASRRPTGGESGNGFFAKAASLLAPKAIESDEDEPSSPVPKPKTVSNQQAQVNNEFNTKVKSQVVRTTGMANRVEEGIQELSSIIRKNGVHDQAEGGVATMTFGDLTKLYEGVDEMLVGILMRAKKKKKVGYVGDMLFAGIHDNVKITLLS